MVADALELDPLRQMEVYLPVELMERLKLVRLGKLLTQVLHTLIAYYSRY